ncbi:hypothetical protein FJZ19_00225 [Candidatus Pacearchaeota archaeon]|nr:hypothetical protein [Candidatus Pacearchaeota archaeon]
MKKRKIKEDKHESQLKWVLAILGIIIAIMAAIFLVEMGSSKFEYLGVKFEKIQQGSRIEYNALFPLADASGKVTAYMPFTFSEDPRKLRNIKINGTIKLKKNVAFSATKEVIMEKCDDSILAPSRLNSFLVSAGLNLKEYTVVVNETEAVERNLTYSDCGNLDEKYSVILFEKGSNDKIIKDENCYRLQIANCNFMNVTERFMMGVYASNRGIDI